MAVCVIGGAFLGRERREVSPRSMPKGVKHVQAASRSGDAWWRGAPLVTTLGTATGTRSPPRAGSWQEHSRSGPPAMAHPHDLQGLRPRGAASATLSGVTAWPKDSNWNHPHPRPRRNRPTTWHDAPRTSPPSPRRPTGRRSAGPHHTPGQPRRSPQRPPRRDPRHDQPSPDTQRGLSLR